jgi:hypothetical protein
VVEDVVVLDEVLVVLPDPLLEGRRQVERALVFVAARSGGLAFRTGVDLMKPFRPKFTDKTKFGQI